MSIWTRALLGVGVCVVFLVLRATARLAFSTVRALRTVRELTPSLQKYADAAYEMFLRAPDRWVVFRGIPSESDIRRLPRTDKWVFGRKPLGPWSFRVPQLGNGVVTVFGVSLDCGPDLVRFIHQKETEEGALSGQSVGK